MNSFSNFGYFLSSVKRITSTPTPVTGAFGGLISEASKNIYFDFIMGQAYTDLSAIRPYSGTTAGLNLNNDHTTLARLNCGGNPIRTSDFASTSFTIYLKYLSPANNNTIYPFGKQFPSIFGLSKIAVLSGSSFDANFYSLLDPGTTVSYTITGAGISYLTGSSAFSGTATAPYQTMTYTFTRAGYVLFPTASSLSSVPNVSIPSPTPLTTYTVTVSGGVFWLNGSLKQYYPTFIAGNAYLFDQSSITNIGNTLVFGESADNLTNYTTGVTPNGIAGGAGAYTLLNFTSLTSNSLLYYSNTVASMGDKYPPGAPTINTTVIGGESVSVAVTPPTNTGGLTLTGSSISSYTVSAATLTSLVYSVVKSSTDTSSPIVVTGLTGGTSYYFKVAATNAYGDMGAYSGYTTTAAVPRYQAGAPTSITATSGIQSATVAFVAPALKGGTTANSATITSYTVIAATLANGVYSVFSTTTPTTLSLSITVTGLTNGTSYYFKVAATNSSNDIGTYSIYTSAVVPRTSPGAPTINSTSIGGGSVYVSFTAPTDTGGTTISYYTVSAATSPSTGVYSVVATTTGSSSPILVTGLSGGTSYYFKVAATNIFEEIGTYSAYTTDGAIPRYPAGAPTSITTTLGNQFVTVGFIAPSLAGGSMSDNSSTISYYNVTASIVSGGIYSVFSTTQTTSYSLDITGLANGTSYYFKVAATNALADIGIYSAYTTAVIPRTVPGVPTSITTTNGGGSVSVSFIGPSDTGGASITSYIVSTATLAGGVYSDIGGTTTGSSTTISVTGLIAGTSYYFKVRAQNSFSELGSYSAYTTVAAVPNALFDAAVANFNVVGVGSNCFTCTWKKPTTAVTTYRLVYNPNDGTSITTSDFSATSLSENVQYSYLGYTLKNIASIPTAFTVTLSYASATLNYGSTKNVSNTKIISSPATNLNYSTSTINSFTVIKFTATVSSFATPTEVASSGTSVQKAAVILVGKGGDGSNSGGGSNWEAGGGSGGGVALYPLYNTNTYSITPSTTTAITIGTTKTSFGSSLDVSAGNNGAAGIGSSGTGGGAGGAAVSNTINSVTFTSGSGGSGQTQSIGTSAYCASTTGVNLVIPEMDTSYNFSGGGGGGINTCTNITMSAFVDLCSARNSIYGGGIGGHTAGTNPTIAAGGATAGTANTGGGGGGKGEQVIVSVTGGSGVVYLYYSTYNFTVS